MQTTETVYHVDVVGHIWQPGVGLCAQSVTVREPLELPQADDETDAEYLIRMVECAAHHQLGDFSGVVAFQITAVDTTRAQTPDGLTVTTTYRDLSVFNEDMELAFSDAMFGVDT